MEPELSLHDRAAEYTYSKHKQGKCLAPHTIACQVHIGSAVHRFLAHEYSVDLCIRLGMHTLADTVFAYFKQILCHLLTAFFFFKFPPSHTILNTCTEQTLCLCIVYISNTCVHWYFVYHWKGRTRTGAGMSWLVPYSLLQVVRLLQSAPTHLPHVHQNVLCFTRDRHLVI